MGVLTDFFAATESQLAEVFVGWHTVSNTPIQRETTNPFSGEAIIVNDWQPGPLIREGELVDSPAIEALPHSHFKGVDHVKLGTLYKLVSGDKHEHFIDTLSKPALIYPEGEDIGLHQIPSALTSALATLSENKHAEVAMKWQLTEECQLDRFTVDDCETVVKELHSLAQEAVKLHGSLYFLWSL